MMPMRRFWIIGGGRFGQTAMRRIMRRIPDARVTIVDRELIASIPERVAGVHADGIEWMVDRLNKGLAADMIVPAIPLHVAFEWISRNVPPNCTIEPLEPSSGMLSRLPHPLRGSAGRVYVSHADFICPDHCTEPADVCTYTGKPRPTDLFRLLAELDVDAVVPIVLRSFQLLPGVGGLYPLHLRNALEQVLDHPHQPLMIATACRCHGVLDFIRLHEGSASTQSAGVS